ncbi:HAMP domain-containing histidine kinase [Sulfidibacter corallicola]|uniref:histidine kinase n=1 Tax=Sulfidibacter corallicola TaxID=2818388 RepID=A0A8A4TVL8_SULCO|nr:HAMP domain-containing sensor histidine kinase [Sulfidibacter corallicola]QTD53550.1 HAMP domain-containing histidine kinase [Sulfidibacter corallicola]
MNIKLLWPSLILMFGAAFLTFHLFQSQFSGGLLNVALDPRVREMLAQGMDDQKALADLDPERELEYRSRFEELKQFQARYLILEHNREQIESRFELAMMIVLALILGGSAAFYYWDYATGERRLRRLQTHLAALAEGRTDIVVDDHRRDRLGRIARMIEETSRVIAVQRTRLASLENLSSWQEAARRHAHEIRTPLTAARMELNQLRRLIRDRAPDLTVAYTEIEESVQEELDRLKEFTQEFTSFARLGQPKPEPVDMDHMLARFATFFEDAWEHLTLDFEQPERPTPTLELDREMVRRVLMNLCNNAALAMADRPGLIRFAARTEGSQVVVSIRDDGPGIDPKVRPHLFKPYTTTRAIGEGMGLGLSICKKIMLDHGGDLLLAHTGSDGTEFHLIFALPSGTDRERPSEQNKERAHEHD